MISNMAARLQLLAGVRKRTDETELSIHDMRSILRQGEPKDLDAKLRFASAHDAVTALDHLAPVAHEAIMTALARVLDEAPDIDPEIEIADLLEVVFAKY